MHHSELRNKILCHSGPYHLAYEAVCVYTLLTHKSLSSCRLSNCWGVAVLVFYILMAPKCKCSDIHIWMPKRNLKLVLISEKVCMYRKIHNIYGIWDYPWFRALLGALGMCPPWIKKDHCIFKTLENRISKRVYTSMFIAVLFIIAKKLEQLNSLSVGKETKCSVYVQWKIIQSSKRRKYCHSYKIGKPLEGEGNGELFSGCRVSVL